MTINFNSIPINILTPGQYIEYDNSQAVQGLPVMPSRILIFGQMLETGSKAPNVPVQIFTSSQGVGYFGRGSQLARMLAALGGVNPWTETWAIALADNAAGVAATGSVEFTAVPTTAGTFNLYIAGTLVQIGADTTDTTATLATALVAAIAALPDLPVTAAVDGETAAKANITARHKGLCGNDIDLRVNYYSTDTTPAGLAWTVTALSGGTTAPDLTDMIAAMGDTWYNTLIGPYADDASVAAINTELTRRFGPMVMADGLYFTAAAGSPGTLASLGSGLNDELVNIMGSGLSPTEPCLFAAVVGGIVAYYGNIDPARPFQTLGMTGILAPAKEDQFIQSERSLLLGDGISTYTVDQGGNCTIERLVTTYKTNADGVPDISYRDVNTLLTLAYIRYSTRARIALKFPRCKLADDGVTYGAGQAIVTPSIIRNELIALAGEWVDAGIMEDIADFKTALDVERDGTDPNRVDALLPPNLVNQFRVFAAQVQFIL